MDAFSSVQVKVDHLLNSHRTALANPKWTTDGVGEGDEQRLLQNFLWCHSIYASLGCGSRAVIVDITQRMATGMAESVGKDLGVRPAPVPKII